MPIKTENKNRYPKNWNEISHYIRVVRAQGKCEFCGVENYSIGFWMRDKFIKIENSHQGEMDELDAIAAGYKIIKIVLTTAHLDHIPENCDESNLKALCQRCHNRYDVKHRKHTRHETKNKGVLFINF